MRFSAKCVVGVLAVTLLVLVGCARTAQRPPDTPETASTGDANNFGGAPAVEIPADAKAMGAFLIAETANNDNDREGAARRPSQGDRRCVPLAFSFLHSVWPSRE